MTQQLSIVFYPSKFLKTSAENVSVVDSTIVASANIMTDIMLSRNLVGIGANMVGLLKRIIVVNLGFNSSPDPLILINPVIISKGLDLHKCIESSPSLPGISAEISRAKDISVQFLDVNGASCVKEFADFMSSVVQHEIDYLDGITFLDRLSKMKRDLLVTKMMKYMRANPPHTHTHHGCCGH